MSWNEPPATAEQAWRTATIILVALPLGVTLFAAIVLFALSPEAADDSFWETLWIAYTLLTVAGVAVLWHRVVRPHLPATGTRSTPVSADEYGPLQTGLVICMAIVEGAALFGVVTVMLGADRLVAVASVALVWTAWFVVRPRREWYGLR